MKISNVNVVVLPMDRIICSARALAKLTAMKRIEMIYLRRYSKTFASIHSHDAYTPWPSTRRGCSRETNNGMANPSGGIHHGGRNGEDRRQANTWFFRGYPAHRSLVSTTFRPPGPTCRNNREQLQPRWTREALSKDRTLWKEYRILMRL